MTHTGTLFRPKAANSEWYPFMNRSESVTFLDLVTHQISENKMTSMNLAKGKGEFPDGYKECFICR